MKKLLIFIFLVIIAIFLSRNIIIKESLKYYLKSNFKAKASFEKVGLSLKKVVLYDTNLIKGGLQFRAKRIEWGYNLSFPTQLSTDFLKIIDAQLKDQILGSLNFNLIPFQQHYLLQGENLLVRNKKIADFNLSLKFSDNKIHFYNLESNFINPAASLSGYINLSNFNNICINLVAEDLSLSAIVFLFAKKEELALKGQFNGKANCCFQDNKISQLNLDVDNLEGGMINLKKKTSLDFLKKRVDERSYFYLLDNLKNYKYDKGSIEADLTKNDIVFRANFSSKELGERNITVKLHNIFAK